MHGGSKDGCIALFSNVRMRFWRFEWGIIGLELCSEAWDPPECLLFVLVPERPRWQAKSGF